MLIECFEIPVSPEADGHAPENRGQTGEGNVFRLTSGNFEEPFLDHLNQPAPGGNRPAPRRARRPATPRAELPRGNPFLESHGNLVNTDIVTLQPRKGFVEERNVGAHIGAKHFNLIERNPLGQAATKHAANFIDLAHRPEDVC